MPSYTRSYSLVVLEVSRPTSRCGRGLLFVNPSGKMLFSSGFWKLAMGNGEGGVDRWVISVSVAEELLSVIKAGETAWSPHKHDALGSVVT